MKRIRYLMFKKVDLRVGGRLTLKKYLPRPTYVPCTIVSIYIGWQGFISMSIFLI